MFYYLIPLAIIQRAVAYYSDQNVVVTFEKRQMWSADVQTYFTF